MANRFIRIEGEPSPFPDAAWLDRLKDLPEGDFVNLVVGTPCPPPSALRDEVAQAQALRRGTFEMTAPATHEATVRPRRAFDVGLQGRGRWVVERHAVAPAFLGFTHCALVDERCYRTRSAARQAAKAWRALP